MLIIPIITSMDLRKFNLTKDFFSIYIKEFWNNIETNCLKGMFGGSSHSTHSVN